MNMQAEQAVTQTIDYLVAHYDQHPDLGDLAQRVGYEPTHYQKLFKAYVGISPKRFVQYMTYRHARQLLQDGQTTLETAFALGMSGNGRLHDLFVSCEAAPPGVVQKKGAGLTIRYGYHVSPIGELMIGVTDKGVCWLGFVVDEDRAVPLQRMREHWPKATCIESAVETALAAAQILKIWGGQGDVHNKLKLDLHGTNFQLQIWRALLKIPTGALTNYETLAKAIGKPKAARAVGNAVGSNPISVLIPCHRVIQKSGVLNNYEWGSARKKMILGLEFEHIGHSE